MAGEIDPQSGARRAWWRHAPQGLTLAVFAVVALALLGAFALIAATLEAERVQRAQAARTGAVVATLGAIETAALNGETAQRGYFITLDRRYLEPYARGRARWQAERATLRRRIEADLAPDQAALLDAIDRLGDAKWAELADTIALVRQGHVIEAHQRILSDEGELAMRGLRRAVAGLRAIEQGRLDRATRAAAVAEGRIVPALALLFAVIVAALGLGLWQAIRAARAEAAAANAAIVAEARDRADLLAQELNHRVKNLFAVILAIVRMSGRDDPGAAGVVDRIAQRIHALVTAHNVTQGHHAFAPHDGGTMDLAELVDKTLAPYRSASARATTIGGPLPVPGRHAVPLGLVLHELVTNAVKYGAWAQAGGEIRVSWRAEGDSVELNWQELAPGPVQPPPANAAGGSREGFGSMLIRSSARQLGGTIARRFEPNGIAVEITFPLGG